VLALIVFVAGLFLLVFVRAVAGYVRTGDRLHGATIMVFLSVGTLFFLQVARLFVALPEWISVAAVLLLLGQPVFTLRLVALLRPLSPLVTGSWIAAWAAVAGAVALTYPLTDAMVAVVVGYFVLGEAVAAMFLAGEVRRRTGAPRIRVSAAAVATGLFALGMLLAGIGRYAGDAAQEFSVGSRLVALASACGYVAAFVPPRFLRQQWSARTAYLLMTRLLEHSTGAPEETWARYARLGAEAVDADVAVVVSLPAAGRPEALAVAGRERDQLSPTELAQVLAHADRPGPARGAERHDTHFVTRVPLPLHGGADGVLVLLSRRRSLFTDDDSTLLGELGRQAAVMAERSLLTTELRGVVEQLRAANHAKSDFVAAMSHELRTPLNAIIGFSELMRDEEPTGDDRRQVPTEWIENVYSSGRHLLGLINDVLDLAKVEAGRIDLRPERLTLGAAVNEAAAPLRPLVDTKGLTLVTDVPELTVRADRLRLRQMITNLVSNAIKFTPEGGTITISARDDAGAVHLSIADTGPGIAEADQRRVFEEFRQLGDAGTRAAGTGLGLALTQRLAQAHGGGVEVDSTVGAGSTFTLRLPTTSVTDARGGILVIEDDPAAASLLRTYLQAAGYQTIISANGGDGLAVARTVAPDVILLDVLLPGLDGWGVLRQLKEDPALRHIPVVMVSVVEERELGLSLGAVDFFVKPVDRQALLGWLDRRGLIPLPPGAQTRVLVVDPDPTGRTAVESALIDQGLTVFTATGGAEALRLARDTRFDLVLSGLIGPDLDGFGLVAALHDDPRTRDVPVVIIADELSDEDKARLGDRILGVLPRDGLAPTDLREWLDRAVLSGAHR
jgi:signal transduction histidine kinase/CheY-like chemotaxis protein